MLKRRSEPGTGQRREYDLAFELFSLWGGVMQVLTQGLRGRSKLKTR